MIVKFTLGAEIFMQFYLHRRIPLEQTLLCIFKKFHIFTVFTHSVLLHVFKTVWIN